MKKKILFVLFAVAMLTVLFAISVSAAAEMILTKDDIASMTSTGTGAGDYGSLEYLFDGELTGSGWFNGYIPGDGWSWGGVQNSIATITFKEEFIITAIDSYIWTNWKPGYTVKFLDAEGRETYSLELTDFNHTVDTPYSMPMPETPFKAKQIVLTRYNCGADRTINFLFIELEIYVQHSCNFTIPGDIVLDPTCAMDGEQEYFCRCGESQNELIPPTGEHSISDRVVYRDGFNYPGIIATACATCSTQDEKIDDVPAMFKSLGYSASEFGKNGVTHGVFVDWDAIATFNEYAARNNESSIDFGMVAGARSAFSNGNPLTITSNGVGVASNVLAFKSFADTDASLISYSLNGFGDMYKDTQLIVSAYIYDGNEIYYLSGDDCYTEVSTVSYNEVLDIAAPPVIEATVKEN